LSIWMNETDSLHAKKKQGQTDAQLGTG
jgi:hypothetical protein